jgi:nucleotidyltransferase/DNA polymerase involved in DNA repair
MTERLLAVWVEALGEESPDGSTLREHAALLDALTILCPFTESIRLGLLVLPLRGPSRFFGGEGAVLDAGRQSVRDVTGHEPLLGVADGLFCAEVAARRGLVLASGATDLFRRSLPLSVLGRKDVATTCQRLGLHTVGSFADLDAARVAERFNGHALTLHRVARGESAELDGQRDLKLARRLGQLRGEDGVGDEQLGFFGQRGAGDLRAEAAAHRVRRRLGVDAVVVAALRGGRVPEDRATLVPWGSPSSKVRDGAPWPGQMRAPSPATTLAHPVAVQLRDGEDHQIVMEPRGFLSEPPGALLFSSQLRRDVVWHAGPWPLVERWWSLNRRRAHLQVLLATGEALLLTAEASRWWLVGIYD